MQNLTISFPLVNGDSLPYDIETGEELISKILGDDCNPPPRSMVLDVVTSDGRQISITIPNNDSVTVGVSIEDV